MLYETGIGWTLEEAKKRASSRVKLDGWDRIEYGKLVREDGKEVFAIAIPAKISPNKKINALASEWRMDTHEWKKSGAIIRKK